MVLFLNFFSSGCQDDLTLGFIYLSFQYSDGGFKKKYHSNKFMFEFNRKKYFRPVSVSVLLVSSNIFGFCIHQYFVSFVLNNLTGRLKRSISPILLGGILILDEVTATLFVIVTFHLIWQLTFDYFKYSFNSGIGKPFQILGFIRYRWSLGGRIT